MRHISKRYEAMSNNFLSLFQHNVCYNSGLHFFAWKFVLVFIIYVFVPISTFHPVHQNDSFHKMKMSFAHLCSILAGLGLSQYHSDRSIYEEYISRVDASVCACVYVCVCMCVLGGGVYSAVR